VWLAIFLLDFKTVVQKLTDSHAKVFSAYRTLGFDQVVAFFFIAVTLKLAKLPLANPNTLNLAALISFESTRNWKIMENGARNQADLVSLEVCKMLSASVADNGESRTPETFRDEDMMRS
jgi:hypothetical protein